jgi:DNA-binding LacI/PurR family transcriptional regulator
VSRQATLQIIADHVGVSRKTVSNAFSRPDELSGRMRPMLTTVRQDVDAKGRAAAEALHVAIEQVRAGRSVTPEHVLLPTDLVARETTAVR